MITWILNIIGIFVYFITKYAGKKDSTTFSFRYWIGDNWPELVSTLLLNIALMLLLLQPETTINIDEWLSNNIPFGLAIAVKPLFALLLGLGLSSFLYGLFKKKIKK